MALPRRGFHHTSFLSLFPPRFSPLNLKDWLSPSREQCFQRTFQWVMGNGPTIGEKAAKGAFSVLCTSPQRRSGLCTVSFPYVPKYRGPGFGDSTQWWRKLYQGKRRKTFTVDANVLVVVGVGQLESSRQVEVLSCVVVLKCSTCPQPLFKWYSLSSVSVTVPLCWSQFSLRLNWWKRALFCKKGEQEQWANVLLPFGKPQLFATCSKRVCQFFFFNMKSIV